MAQVYPDYSDQVAFYAVGEDPTESLEELQRYRQRAGHPWPVASFDSNIIKGFRVLDRSTKVAINSRGIITYRAGYGRGNADDWHRVFRELVETAQE